MHHIKRRVQRAKAKLHAAKVALKIAKARHSKRAIRICRHRLAKWTNKVRVCKAKKHILRKRLEKVIIKAVTIKAHIKKDVAKTKAKRVAKLEAKYIRAKIALRRAMHAGQKHRVVHYRHKIVTIRHKITKCRRHAYKAARAAHRAFKKESRCRVRITTHNAKKAVRKVHTCRHKLASARVHWREAKKTGNKRLIRKAFARVEKYRVKYTSCKLRASRKVIRAS